jgi:hypothetical protein
VGIEFQDDEGGKALKVQIKPLPEGGQGLSWDVFGPELRDSPILFSPEDGNPLVFVGNDIRLDWGLLRLTDYGFSAAGGGSVFFGIDLLALSQYDLFVASGGLILVEYNALEIAEYEVGVNGGNVLLLTDDTPLLLNDGTPLLLEAA